MNDRRDGVGRSLRLALLNSEHDFYDDFDEQDIVRRQELTPSL